MLAVFRVEKNRNYTVMSNYHLRDQSLSLKAKGLMSMILSLPDGWHYSTRGLAVICKEGVGAISAGVKELELAGYVRRNQLRDGHGRLADIEYVIYEQPLSDSPCSENPRTVNPDTAEPDTVEPFTEMHAKMALSTSSIIPMTVIPGVTSIAPDFRQCLLMWKREKLVRLSSRI